MFYEKGNVPKLHDPETFFMKNPLKNGNVEQLSRREHKIPKLAPFFNITDSSSIFLDWKIWRHKMGWDFIAYEFERYF